ncbi:prohibitin family protein [Cyclospora cayetanensis]|uniref:Prohibitin family protein n=1 Tax=Cyclospora cayetanensis TaxID=88456 RepID=A0A1D3CSM9_9EIME|nr:prohibitin family protein [Cyclospora cayetanensis]
MRGLLLAFADSPLEFGVVRSTCLKATWRFSRSVEMAFLQVRIQPKLAFVPEIFLHFGKQYAREFLDHEARSDILAVCKEATFDTLLGVGEDADAAKDQILNRLRDAATFYKLVITEAKIILRDPNAEED